MGINVKLDVYKTDGKSSGEQMALPAKVFDVEPNDHVIWLVVTAEMTNNRQGTAQAKTRAAVSGGGRKPWPQKGRGSARAGSTRSPVWVGGGKAFGPSPRNYNKKVTKKVSRLARKSALTYKAREDRIKLVEDFTFEKPRTKQMEGILKQLELSSEKTLLITHETDRSLWLSSRNIPKLSIKQADGFSTYDVLNAEKLLIQKSALKRVDEVLGK
ncbi:MAG: 50S ribosomal protein L4 [Desulfobacterales bacterium]|nr:50S ribosomal protein L4 [Desulfobacterales bacterium]